MGLGGYPCRFKGVSDADAAMAGTSYLFVFGILRTDNIHSPLAYNDAAAVAHDLNRRPDLHPPRQRSDWRCSRSGKTSNCNTVGMGDGCSAKPHEKWATRGE